MTSTTPTKLLILGIFALSACAPRPYHTKAAAEHGNETVAAAQSPEATPAPPHPNTRMARRVSALLMKSEMLLGPEDVLEIKVTDHPELTTTTTVDPWGFIKVPYIKGLQINGLTEDMVEDILTQKYAEFFRQPPEIEVNVLQYNSQVVYVLGSVGHPGKYPLVKGKPMTLRDVIFEAGQPRPEAALWRTWVIRQNGDGTQTLTHVNFDKIYYRGQLEHNMELQAGDIVYLPMTIVDTVVSYIARIVYPISGVAARTAAVATGTATPATTAATTTTSTTVR